MMIWKPRNGVEEAKTPAATPAAIECGEAVSLSTRFEMYCQERENERRGQTRVRTLS
jgi:hypothetical protein